MERSLPQDLKYGIIYLFSDRNQAPGLRNPEPVLQGYVSPLQVQWVNDPGREGMLLVARRFNVGNIGRYATVSLSLTGTNHYDGWLEAIRHFADALMGVADDDDGDIVIDEIDFVPCDGSFSDGFLPGAVFHEYAVEEEPEKPKARLKRRIKEKVDDFIGKKPERRSRSRVVVQQSTMHSIVIPNLEDEEKREVERLEHERAMALERIKRAIVSYIAQYHDDPRDLMDELLRGKVVVGKPGRVLVNGDLRIVLPEYDEMEILMPAMCRTLYILFMKQRKTGHDGIILRDIGEYRDEIIDIYGMVKPGASERRVLQSVDNLCDPLGDSLNQMISRINRCVRNVIADKELAKQYIIAGTKGGVYRIAINPDCLELPRAVMP